MNRLYIVVMIVFVTVFADDARAQSAPSEPVQDVSRHHISISAGYAESGAGDFRGFHEALVAAYVDEGIAIPTQRLFPGSMMAGIDILRERPRSLIWGSRFGIGMRYVKTNAYSLYGDYAGTLDVVSSVHVLSLESVSRLEWRQNRTVQPFVGSRGGALLAMTSTREALDLGGLGASTVELNGRGFGFTIEGFVGAKANVSPVAFVMQLGYRYGRVGKLRGEERIDGQRQRSGTLPYHLTLTGVTATAGVVIPLF